MLRPRAWLAALLLTQLATGCATLYTAREVGYNHQRLDAVDRAYAEGGQLWVSYTAYNSAYPAGGGASVAHWAKVELGQLRWVPQGAMLAQPPLSFAPQDGSLEPPAGAARIALYNTVGGGWTPAVPDAVAHYRAQLQRNDASRRPFAAYEIPGAPTGELLLIRDDPVHPGEIEVARLAPETEFAYGPLKRAALYPFALAYDVLTAPLQLLLYWGLSTMKAM